MDLFQPAHLIVITAKSTGYVLKHIQISLATNDEQEKSISTKKIQSSPGRSRTCPR